MILSPTDDALEPDRMRASVRLLDTGEAQHVGDQAEAASEALAGGDVLVISSTTTSSVCSSCSSFSLPIDSGTRTPRRRAAMNPAPVVWFALATVQTAVAPQHRAALRAPRRSVHRPITATLRGAAMAMIERYWGRRGVHAQTSPTPSVTTSMVS